MSGEAEQHTGEDTGVEPGLAVDAAEPGQAPAGDAAADTDDADTDAADTDAADGDVIDPDGGADTADIADIAEAGGEDPIGASGEPTDEDPAGAVAAVAPGPGAADTLAEQDAPAPTPSALRIDYGAHLEANYPRLVAQLYAITLDAAEAHDVVQDAYSRAWRQWAEVGRSPDPAAWVRRVAVRSTIRSWRRLAARLRPGRGRRPLDDGSDPRTRALLAALGRLPAAQRRAVVLFHMAGVSAAEIAAVERVSVDAVYARLHPARNVVIEGMADVLTAVLGTDEELEYR